MWGAYLKSRYSLMVEIIAEAELFVPDGVGKGICVWWGFWHLGYQPGLQVTFQMAFNLQQNKSLNFDQTQLGTYVHG